MSYLETGEERDGRETGEREGRETRGTREKREKREKRKEREEEREHMSVLRKKSSTQCNQVVYRGVCVFICVCV